MGIASLSLCTSTDLFLRKFDVALHLISFICEYLRYNIVTVDQRLRVFNILLNDVFFLVIFAFHFL
jgi:hypothetical protein